MPKLLAVSTGNAGQLPLRCRRLPRPAESPTSTSRSGKGFFAPRGYAGEVVARLNTEINRILQEPDVKARLVDAGAEVTPMSVGQFEAFVKAKVVKLAAIIRNAASKSRGRTSRAL